MKTLPLIVIALAVSVMESAVAHTELAETVPADRAVIEAAPEDVRLRFTEPVRLTALAIQKDGAPKQSLGPLPSETMEEFTVALPRIDDGHYVVAWRALSEDTHVMTGEFMFAVGAGTSHDEHTNDVISADDGQSEQASEDHGHDDGGAH